MNRSVWGAAAALAISIAMTITAPAVARPKIKLSVKSGHPTLAIKIHGGQFGAQQAVDVYFDNTDILVLNTFPNGKFHAKIKIPADAAPGTHYITAIGRRDGDAAHKIFTVRTDWVSRGFNSSDTRNNIYENTIGTGNVASLGLAKAISIGSQVAYSSPAIVDGVAYIAEVDGTVLAVDVATGTTLWSTSIGTGTTPEIDSSPTVADGMVYIPVADSDEGVDGVLYALNASTGAVVWTADITQPGNFDYSSATVVDGVLFIEGDGTVYALDGATGVPVWSKSTGTSGSSTPAVADGVVYVGSSGKKVFALNAASGATIWSSTTGGDVSLSSPAVANGVVYVGAADKKLYALSQADGNQIWTTTNNGPVYSMPVVANGVVYYHTPGDPNGTFYAVNAATGAPLWSADDPATGIFESAAVANGVVYFKAHHLLDACDPKSGDILWQATLPSDSDSSIVVSDGAIYAHETYGAGDSLNIYTINGESPSNLKRHTEPPPFATLQPNRRLKITPSEE